MQNQSTALGIAANWGHEAVVRILLDAGANIEAKNEVRRARRSTTSAPECADSLITTRSAQNGYSPLVCSARNGRHAAAKLLLERGANVDGKDNVRALAFVILQFCRRSGSTACNGFGQVRCGLRDRSPQRTRCPNGTAANLRTPTNQTTEPDAVHQDCPLSCGLQ